MPNQYFSVVSQKYITQHTLTAMIKKTRKILDKGGTFGAPLTDLLKAFDCMTHYLLIAKFHALNFDLNALNLIFDYLTERKKKSKLAPVLPDIWIYFKAPARINFRIAIIQSISL